MPTKPSLPKPAARFALALAIPCAFVVAAGVLVSCAGHKPESSKAIRTVAPVDPPRLGDDTPRDYPGLHNVVAYHDGFYSGSVPEGDAGFDTLAGMGVRTIISVDGAAPEVQYAKARGIRYIHLPIGYNGFDETRKLEIARATRDAMARGPVYVHCHHGKHRSAGAAATTAVSLGWLTPEQAVERMKISGTAPNYKGLYACAAAATAVGADVLESVHSDFPQAAPPKGFVKSMVELDEISEHLKLIEKSGWQAPKDHPDLVPAAEAGRMADILRVLSTGDRAASKPAGFTDGLLSNSAAAQKLEDLLAAGEKDAAKLSAQFKAVADSCKSCHAKFRD